jgi:hypothetical protein
MYSVMNGLVQLLELPPEATAKEEEEDELRGAMESRLEEGDVYTGTYSKLSFAAAPKEDVFSSIPDAKAHLTRSLQTLNTGLC